MLYFILISIFFLLPGRFSLPPLQPKGTRKGGAVGDCEYLSIMEKNYAKSEKKKSFFLTGTLGLLEGGGRRIYFPVCTHANPAAVQGGCQEMCPALGPLTLGHISSRYQRAQRDFQKPLSWLGA